MKIYSDKLNETDRLNLASILIKAGFTVKVGRCKKENGKQGYKYFVEIQSEEGNREVFVE